jgi:signal transduction histidine kinase
LIVLAEFPNLFGDRPPCILIVDDISDNRTILSRRFERHGFECAEADSGLGALDMLERQPFDVVLLDVMMPDLDGLEALGRIRQKYSQDELAVIMVTGKSQSDDIVQALSLGANDYITKPVDFAVALARVSAQARRKRAEEQVRHANQALIHANDELERRIAERTAELVRTNEQLQVAVVEAEAANRAKDQFLATMSHELRTPLNGLVAMGALLTRTPLDAAQKRMTDVISSSARDITAIITDLLDVLDLTTHETILHRDRIRLGDLVRDASASAQASAQAKGLEFKLDLATEAEGFVEVDGPHLSQILAKLLNNAVKFTDVGEIRLSVTRPPSDPTQVVMEVGDSGIGFDPKTLDQLFRPFHQADGSLTRRFGGLGLGLAICSGLVDLMSGRITADSSSQGGTVFRVELPLPAVA